VGETNARLIRAAAGYQFAGHRGLLRNGWGLNIVSTELFYETILAEQGYMVIVGVGY
jgi:hypothetical protein